MAAPLRFGLIGLGRWGRTYVKTLAELGSRCRLSHVCTSQPEKAQAIPHPVTVVSDWQSLIQSDCDAVIIATPPAMHAEMLEHCLAERKPCIVEKPLCLDLPTAERLHRAVSSSGVAVLVNHTHLFDPAYDALKGVLADGRERVRLVVSEGASWGPFRSHTPALWDWAPHDVSLCLDLIGELPEQLQALGGPVDPQGAPEQFSLTLAFPGGAGAWIHAGRLSPQKRRVLGVVTDQHLYTLDQLGTERLMVADMELESRYDGGAPDPLVRRAIPFKSLESPLERVVRYFAVGLQGGDRARFGTALACDVVKVLTRAEQAMRKLRT